MADTKKVVINECFGGFSLSRAAVRRLAELQGRECYFFTHDIKNRSLSTYIPSPTEPEGRRDLFWIAFDIPNPNEALAYAKPWHEMTHDERVAHSGLHRKHSLNSRPDDRDDPLLVQVVEELGEAANGAGAKLKIVEIPADVDYEISEYDGSEHIAETHRTWS